MILSEHCIMLWHVAMTSFNDTLSASLGPCLSFPLPSSHTSLFGMFRGMSGLDDWQSHSVMAVHSTNIHIRFHQHVLQNYVSVCIAVGCLSPWAWYAVSVATKHWQVTSVFMWGLFALCGLYHSSSMLKQMHIYFKLCVFTVSSDDTFSLQECNGNK